MGRLALIPALLILAIACKKANTATTFSGQGVLAGSDTTCGGWVIKASNNTVLDPLNIDSFPINRKDGQPVTFTYYKAQGVMICLLGQPIQLITIQE
jgi:hypothetical protein